MDTHEGNPKTEVQTRLENARFDFDISFGFDRVRAAIDILKAKWALQCIIKSHGEINANEAETSLQVENNQDESCPY